MDYSKASRAIRDVMRENYEKIATLCKSADSLGTGYLSPQTLWKVINDHIMPLKFEDLKLMLRQVLVSFPSLLNYLGSMQQFRRLQLFTIFSTFQLIQLEPK